MKRFGVLVAKEIRYGSYTSKIMTLGFALGYGIGFGFMARMSDAVFQILLDFMPMVIAFVAAIAVVQGISIDKQARTGEMVLTTGISIREYIYSKVADSVIQTTVGVVLFVILFAACGGKIFKGVIRPDTILMPLLAGVVFSIFYACAALIFKVNSVLHKIIIAVFLLIVIAFFVLLMLGTFMEISFTKGIAAVLLWLGLLLYGVICLEAAIRMTKVRDFVAK